MIFTSRDALYRPPGQCATVIAVRCTKRLTISISGVTESGHRASGLLTWSRVPVIVAG
jgi:hypothetical protein